MSTMSPELALVDPELRADAVARLPPIYVNAFLEFPPSPAPPVERRTHKPLASAALAYLLLAVMRTVVFEVAVFVTVFAVVLLASLIG